MAPAMKGAGRSSNIKMPQSFNKTRAKQRERKEAIVT
jgi:hypothetical protein